MSKKTWHGQTPKKRNAATNAVLRVMLELHHERLSKVAIMTLRVLLGRNKKTAPHAPVAQAVRRLRLAGLVRRADGGEGPGLAATYSLTARGRRAARATQP